MCYSVNSQPDGHPILRSFNLGNAIYEILHAMKINIHNQLSNVQPQLSVLLMSPW